MRNKTLTLVLCCAALACTDDENNASATRNTAALDARYVDGEPSCGGEELGGEAPVVTSHELTLWPPNHKLHEISAADCASAVDACGEALNGEFLWASSDEPVDDIGDGHHAPDIVIGTDCDVVAVRSERQGPKDGRVYRFGVRFVDAAGNYTDGECAITVVHDQSGAAANDSGEAYRITLDGSDGLPSCDGIDEPPPPVDAGEPPPVDAGEPPPVDDEDAGEEPPPAPDSGINDPI